MQDGTNPRTPPEERANPDPGSGGSGSKYPRRFSLILQSAPQLVFTGIIEAVGRIAQVDELGGGRRLHVETGFSGSLRPDQSIAVNGACLTVTEASEDRFQVTAVEETLAKTTLGGLGRGDAVNLERALAAGDRLDGHLVQGHVDETGTVRSVRKETDSRLYEIAFDPAHAPFLIPVGSIAVDGISLTVARLGEETFTVSIIPHTYEHTNVPGWERGAAVNLEYDLIGKYVARQLGGGASGGEGTGLSGGSGEERPSGGAHGPSSEQEITLDWLREQGFA